MDSKYLGPIIRFHRKKAQLSQEELGKLAGLRKTVVFDIENGKSSIRFDTALYNLYKSDDCIDTSIEQRCRRLTQ